MTWEYRISAPPTLMGMPKATERWLNELGNEGWELVFVAGAQWVFKRAVQVVYPMGGRA